MNDVPGIVSPCSWLRWPRSRSVVKGSHAETVASPCHRTHMSKAEARRTRRPQASLGSAPALGSSWLIPGTLRTGLWPEPPP